MQIHRGGFIQAGAISAAALATHPLDGIPTQPLDEQERAADGSFWPNGARMVISVSMQMEAGAQPLSGAESPMPKIDSKYPISRRPSGTNTDSRRGFHGCWICSIAEE